MIEVSFFSLFLDFSSMYWNPNAIISPNKLTEYLLIPLPRDDKSQYLAQGSYTLDNWQQLERDLRGQILNIKTIWIVTEQTTKFVTLFPA